MAHQKTYTLGKGRVAFRLDNDDGSKGDAHRDLGNAPEVNLTLTIEKLDHMSSREGISLKDLSIIRSSEAMLTITLDEPDHENIARFFMSKEQLDRAQAVQAWVVPAASGENVGSEENTPGTGIADATTAKILVPQDGLGVWLPLYIDAGGGDYQRVHSISQLEIYDGADPLTDNLMVEGGMDEELANYELDMDSGMIYIHDDQSGCANPIDPSAAAVELYGFAAWSAMSEIPANFAMTRTALKGHLLFTGKPPQGQAMDVEAYVSLTPTGDFAMISDDWTTFQLEAECLEHSDYEDPSGRTSLFKIVNRMQVNS